MLNDQTGKLNFKPVLFTIIFISLIAKYIILCYGLPFTSHVDEGTILKDPLKILLTYSHLDFSISTNFYNWILIFWHFITFIGGKIFGQWNSFDDYLNFVAIDSYKVLFSFRILNAILSTLGNVILLNLIFRKFKSGTFIKTLMALVIVLNPVEWNSFGYIKFDAICYLMYAIIIYNGYLYFTEKHDIRRRLYGILFLSVATRIECIAFLAGYAFYDFYFIYKGDIKSYLSGKTISILLTSILIYCAITLIPFTLLYNTLATAKVNITGTKTFEEVIFTKSSFGYFKYYDLYINIALYLLGLPVVIAFLIQLFRKNASTFVLVIPFFILNAALAFDRAKNVFYFLASSLIILYLFIWFCDTMQKRKIAMGLLVFTIAYFISFNIPMLYYMKGAHTLNAEVRSTVMKYTSVNDTIVLQGIVDLLMYDSPAMAREKIKSIEEVGGSTGKGIKTRLDLALKDSNATRNFYVRDFDYFWTNSKYENKWLIGFDTLRLVELNPKMIVIFTNLDGPHAKNDPRLDIYLANNYHMLKQHQYHFTDPRFRYRNFYYFHSYAVYLRK